MTIQEARLTLTKEDKERFNKLVDVFISELEAERAFEDNRFRLSEIGKKIELAKCLRKLVEYLKGDASIDFARGQERHYFFITFEKLGTKHVIQINLGSREVVIDYPKISAKNVREITIFNHGEGETASVRSDNGGSIDLNLDNGIIKQATIT